MPVRLVESHPYIEETRNQLAALRGPIVYCLESIDLPPACAMLDVHLGSDADLAPATDPRLPGITVLKGRATADRARAMVRRAISRCGCRITPARSKFN